MPLVTIFFFLPSFLFFPCVCNNSNYCQASGSSWLWAINYISGNISPRFSLLLSRKVLTITQKTTELRSQVACVANRLCDSYIHTANKVNRGFLTSSASPWPRPDAFQHIVPCCVKSAVALVTFVSDFPPNHALLSKKYQKPCQSSSVLKKGTQYERDSDMFKVIILPQKCYETFRICSSCSHISVWDWDSQTLKDMLQYPKWRRRHSNHRKAIQHSLLTLVQPNRPNFKVVSFVFKCKKYTF